MPETPKSTKILISAILIFIIFPVFILGQEDFSLPNPGLTPDSPFYFFDTLWEKVSLFFTFAPEKKAEKAIQFAEEKLAEMRAMAEKNKPEAIEKANQKYQEFLSLANKKTLEAKERGKDVEELAILITEKTLKHQEILLEVFEKVPEQAKIAVEKAIETSRKGSELAVQAVTGAKKDELLQKIEKIRIEKEEAPLPAKEEIPPEKELPEEKPTEEKEPEVIKPEVTCKDECSSTGLKKCSNNGYQICGNYDEDNCLEWSSVTSCPPNTICQNGNCIQQTCSDGTPYSQCSGNKPLYCDKGSLINKCSLCGCPSGEECQADGSCIVPSIVQCTSGPCCDISTKKFKPTTYKCQENIKTEYGCPWGSSAGNDVGIRSQHRYCSGSSANCDGPLKWGDWVIYKDCASNEACVNGICKPLTCSDGTPYGQCSTNKPKYCDSGNLIDKCSICGCPANKECQSNESCTIVGAVTCADSDGGINEWVYGKVTKEGNIRYDSCSGTGTDYIKWTTLREWYCSSGGMMEYKFIECSNGCIDGVCKKSTGNDSSTGVICIDSDGGKDYYTYGKVTHSDGRTISADICKSDTVLKESYCDNGYYAYEFYTCPNGCQGGVCL